MKSTATPKKSKKQSRIIIGLIAAAIAVVALSAGGFAFAATQESHDQFCASCHTQPESTFVARSTSTPFIWLRITLPRIRCASTAIPGQG